MSPFFTKKYNHMNNKTIIFSTIGFLLVSFIFLAFTERRQQDPNSQNWWAIYFENPKNNSLNFVIENHSSNESFQWEIAADKDSVTKGIVNIKKGDKKTIPVSSNSITNKKITITVTSGNSKKEIYKNL